MAAIADSGYPNIVNVLNAMSPDGGIEAQMANILMKELPIVQDIPWQMGNLPTGHQIISITGLPSPTWRKLNEGVDPTKPETTPYIEACGMLEAWSKVDVDVAGLNGNTVAYRQMTDKRFLEGFNEELERAIFYESTLTAPERIHGFAPRYDNTTGSVTSDYVMKRGTHSGSNSESVWLINWDPDNVYGIFPKNTMGGLQRKDLGELPARDAAGREFLAYQARYQWKCGLAVADFRRIVRFQWDPDDTTTWPDSGKSFYLALQEMIDTVHKLGPNARFYMSRKSRKKLNAQLASNSANFLEWIDLGGRRVPSFMGVPIRVADKLVGETQIKPIT